MHLLNTKSLELEEPERIEPYAILFPHMEHTEFAMSKRGWAKIKQARSEGIHWAWVDTCCIDKTSSTVLSEAINSMYRWYANSAVCYVYLEDVHLANPQLAEPAELFFHNSRWFRRGWTLQELLAPQRVEFFNQRWSFLGTKAQVQARLARITGIEEKYLVGDVPFSAVPAGLIFSWASKRDTSRPEDMAYCLLGFFDVSLPLLYGEGKNALIRLQEEIIRRNDDYSLFLWRPSFGLLAT
ncbi:heterokaryon incompatibility protein-domain-containing protein [Xylariaceae sp. FL1019]|nr:heterokaryon incompatibility protein-domain-containing protein [Xylariaceae sp. FL1019]